MLNCEFSETQFSFCYTFELLRREFGSLPFRLWPIPLFPNTVVEGRVGGGYDMCVGSLFLQFKIPKVYEKKSFKMSKEWAVFRQSFFAIEVNTDSKQYQLLKDLKRPANVVFYATPEFYESASLDNNYRHSMIEAHSALFAIEDFPRHSSGHHRLIYTETHDHGVLFSKPQNIQKRRLELLAKFQPDPMSIREKARVLLSIIEKVDGEERHVQEMSRRNETGIVMDVFSILWTQFNIFWLPIIENDRH